jgi:hypothetical protein
MKGRLDQPTLAAMKLAFAGQWTITQEMACSPYLPSLDEAFVMAC